MTRIFIALRPPAAMREALRATMHGVPGARWQTDEQLHLTLRFVGEVDRHGVDDIAAALAHVHCPRLMLRVDGVGAFGRDGHPHSLWAGVVPDPDLLRLHRAIDRALVRIGLPPEGRAFRPHITVARLSRSAGPADGWLEAHAALRLGPAPFEHLHLQESVLGHGGSVYTILERYPLG